MNPTSPRLRPGQTHIPAQTANTPADRVQQADAAALSIDSQAVVQQPAAAKYEPVPVPIEFGIKGTYGSANLTSEGGLVFREHDMHYPGGFGDDGRTTIFEFTPQQVAQIAQTLTSHGKQVSVPQLPQHLVSAKKYERSPVTAILSDIRQMGITIPEPRYES